jgi:hypothetical protein
MSKYLFLLAFYSVGCAPFLASLTPKESFTVDPKTAPKVMISIPEYKAGEDAISQSFASTHSETEELFIRKFKAIGYPVIEKSEETSFWANPQAMMFNSNYLETKGADILVVGQAMSDRPKYDHNTTTDFVNIVTPVRIDVKIVKVSTGEVLWVDSYKTNHTESYFGEPNKASSTDDVFRIAAAQLSARVAKDINEKLKPAGNLFYVTVIYGNKAVSNNDLSLFKDSITKGISGVSQVKDKNMSEYSALFEVHYSGDINSLASALGRQKIGSGSCTIESLVQDNIMIRIQ